MVSARYRAAGEQAGGHANDQRVVLLIDAVDDAYNLQHR